MTSTVGLTVPTVRRANYGYIDKKPLVELTFGTYIFWLVVLPKWLDGKQAFLAVFACMSHNMTRLACCLFSLSTLLIPLTS